MELPHHHPSKEVPPEAPWYNRVLSAINATTPFLLPTHAANLALLVSSILKKRTLCLSELAQAYPTPDERPVAVPKHNLLHRLKRLWRFTDNERVDALTTHMTFVPHLLGRLGFPRWLGLAIDWTKCSTLLCPPVRGCATPSLAHRYPPQGTSPAAFATGLRPGRSPGEQEPEPA